jgi:type VI secretion system ImpC/EvpB family protein
MSTESVPKPDRVPEPEKKSLINDPIQATPTSSGKDSRDDLMRMMIDHLKAKMACHPSNAEYSKKANQQLIAQCIAQVIKSAKVVAGVAETKIKYMIGEIDKKLTSQLNAILHTPEFQKLEGTWRGLHYLIKQSRTSENLVIRVLNCSKPDLGKDLEKAVEFDQSALYKKVYEDQFGLGWGQPFGVLVGDYEFGHHPDHIRLLQMIASIAAEVRAPFKTMPQYLPQGMPSGPLQLIYGLL